MAAHAGPATRATPRLAVHREDDRLTPRPEAEKSLVAGGGIP